MATRTTKDDQISYTPPGSESDEAFQNILNNEPGLVAAGDQYDAEMRDKLQAKESQPRDNLHSTEEKEKLGLYNPSHLDSNKAKRSPVEKVPLSLRRKTAGVIVGALMSAAAFFGLGSLGGVTIVNFKEVIVQHVGANLETVVDGRQNKIWVKKINASSKTPHIKGLCTAKISVACRFSGLSEKAIKNIETKSKGKVQIETSGKANILGNLPVKSITIDGNKMSPQQYAAALDPSKPNPAVVSAMRGVMKPRFSAWIGSSVSSLMGKLGITKAARVSLETDVDKAKARIATNQQGVVDVDSSGRLTPADDDPDADKKNAANQLTDDLVGDDYKSASLGDRLRTSALKNLSSTAQDTVKSAAGTLAKSLLVTGYLDSACTVFNIISATGYMAKAVGAVQLIRFSMSLMNEADAIKAGEATTASIQAFGEMLSTPSPGDNRVAWDSFAYQLAAYQIVGDPIDTAEFRVGGGIPGNMIGFVDTVMSTLKGGKICEIIQNPFFRAGSLVAGLFATFFSVGTFNATQLGLSAGLAAGLAVIQAFSLPLIADMIAGEFVNETTVGNSAGNAILSGAGALYAQNSNGTALQPLTKKQAIEFDRKHKAAYLKQSSEESVLATGMFDAMNPNSFAGKLVMKLAPSLNSGSVTDAASRFASAALQPLSAQVNAEMDPAAQYDICTDMEYKQLNIATDPFCNPIYGLSDTAVLMDPDELIAYMYDNKHINADGTPLSAEYTEFLTQCVQNTSPFGLPNEEVTDKIKPLDCVPTKSKFPEQFWVFSIDSIVEEKMDCMLNNNAASCGTGASTGSAGSIDASGWTLEQLNQDSESVACAAGTTDLGTSYEAYRAGKPIKIRLCRVDTLRSVGWSPKGAEGYATVASIVSERYVAMITALQAEVGDIKVLDTFRSFDRQTELWNQYGRNPARVAKPGFSNHQTGYATDFVIRSGDDAYRKGDPVWQWLENNAKSYCFSMYSAELWHWDVDTLRNGGKPCVAGGG